VVKDGDVIELDVPARRLELLILRRDETPAGRWAAARAPLSARLRQDDLDHIFKRNEGCDFDYLRAQQLCMRTAVNEWLLGESGSWLFIITLRNI